MRQRLLRLWQADKSHCLIRLQTNWISEGNRIGSRRHRIREFGLGLVFVLRAGECRKCLAVIGQWIWMFLNAVLTWAIDISDPMRTGLLIRMSSKKAFELWSFYGFINAKEIALRVGFLIHMWRSVGAMGVSFQTLTTSGMAWIRATSSVFSTRPRTM